MKQSAKSKPAVRELFGDKFGPSKCLPATILPDVSLVNHRSWVQSPVEAFQNPRAQKLQSANCEPTVHEFRTGPVLVATN